MKAVSLIEKLGLLGVRIRPVQDSDLNFIRNAWMKTAACGEMECLGRDWQGYANVRDHLLATCKITIACSAGSPRTIAGFAVYEPKGVVHCVYVRQEFRGYGIARAMLSDLTTRKAVIWFTLWSRDLQVKRLPEGWHFSFSRVVPSGGL